MIRSIDQSSLSTYTTAELEALLREARIALSACSYPSPEYEVLSANLQRLLHTIAIRRCNAPRP